MSSLLFSISMELRSTHSFVKKEPAKISKKSLLITNGQCVLTTCINTPGLKTVMTSLWNHALKKHGIECVNYYAKLLHNVHWTLVKNCIRYWHMTQHLLQSLPRHAIWLPVLLESIPLRTVDVFESWVLNCEWLLVYLFCGSFNSAVSSKFIIISRWTVYDDSANDFQWMVQEVITAQWWYRNSICWSDWGKSQHPWSEQ